MSLVSGRSAFYSARKNLLINGDFNVQIRGSTINNYTIDRWLSNPGNGGAATASRQSFTLGQTAVPGEPIYYYRHNQTVAAAVSNPQPVISQPIEGVRTLAGQRAVLSFWAKTSINTTLVPSLRQHFGTGGSPSANIEVYSTVTPYILPITTSWQFFEIPFLLPGISGKTIGSSGTDHLAVRVWLPNSATFTFDLARVQLEAGITATAFEVRDWDQEFEMCQRYYQIGRADCYGQVGLNYYHRATSHLSTPMRAYPTTTYQNLANSGFASTSANCGPILMGNIGGGNIIVCDDRYGTLNGPGYYASEVRCDAELVEA